MLNTIDEVKQRLLNLNEESMKIDDYIELKHKCDKYNIDG